MGSRHPGDGERARRHAVRVLPGGWGGGEGPSADIQNLGWRQAQSTGDNESLWHTIHPSAIGGRQLIVQLIFAEFIRIRHNKVRES